MYDKNNTTDDVRVSLLKNRTIQELNFEYILKLWGFIYVPQKKIGRSYLDFEVIGFYNKFDVEIDGYQHYTLDGKISDLKREKILLDRFGIYTIRMPNSVIDDNQEEELCKIKTKLESMHTKEMCDQRLSEIRDEIKNLQNKRYANSKTAYKKKKSWKKNH